MLLANLQPNYAEPTDDASSKHPFLYGRVIGIYHANVVYTGPGMKGYETMRFDFLHIRWFQLDLAQARGRVQGRNRCDWASLRLDRLSFPPMSEKGSFSFVNPSLVLRSCHLIPAFSSGKARLDGIGLSNMSRDANDWKCYYVNRFADRDMAMRYHWGLGIGHIYSHDCDVRSQQHSTHSSVDDDLHETEPEVPDHASEPHNSIPVEASNPDAVEDFEDDEDSEDDEDYEDDGYSSSSDDDEGSENDEDFLEIHDTYHSD